MIDYAALGPLREHRPRLMPTVENSQVYWEMWHGDKGQISVDLNDAMH